MKYINEFEKVSDFQAFMDENEEGGDALVSYIVETQSSVLKPSENTNKCVYLPCIDTTGFATEFIEGEYYPQEALAFKAIAEMHPRDRTDLYISYSDNGQYMLHTSDNTLEFDITNEPMVLNWISHIDVAKLPLIITDYVTDHQVSLNHEDRGWGGAHWTQINLEDGRCFHNSEGGVGA